MGSGLDTEQASQGNRPTAILVSIIIPTFNAGNTLHSCLESIRIQYSNQLEVLIQDSLSTDDTLTIASHYDFVKVLSEKDNGVYDAMNRAVQRAKGQYLYFLGGDDIILTDFPKAIERLKSQEVDMLYANVQIGNSEELYDGVFDKAKLALKNICHQSIFYQRDLLIQRGGFDLKYPILADYELNLDVFCDASIRIEYVDLCIARFASTGLSHNMIDEQFILDKPNILKSGYYKDHDALSNAYLKRAELNLRDRKISDGIHDMYSWSRMTKKYGRAIYLILAHLNQRWTRA